MSVNTRLAEVVCDGPRCARARSDYGTAATVRAEATKYEGWVTGLSGGKDFCSEACRRAASEGTENPG